MSIPKVDIENKQKKIEWKKKHEAKLAQWVLDRKQKENETI